ncbi:DUF2061 domain-containing protein [Candidatus Saccharibacteria bacterium]|nr:DUF2061 domain-containing protein [Candidatus Saccharibacteria bacterium]
MKLVDTQQRSITKSITFRILVIISDLVVIYLITKRIGATIALTVFTNLASTVLYFAHERVWNRIAWGRKRLK